MVLRSTMGSVAIQALPLTSDQELRQIQQLLAWEDESRSGLREGALYCLLSRRWYVQWCQWAGHCPSGSVSSGESMEVEDGWVWVTAPEEEDGQHLQACDERPRAIDNAQLLQAQGHHDFQIISVGAWELFHRWYGGGPLIKRRAGANSNGKVSVELHGVELEVFRSNALHAPLFRVTEPKTAVVAAVKQRLCEELCLDLSRVRIWDYFDNKKYTNLEVCSAQTLDACRIYSGNAILLEEINHNESFSLEPSPFSDQCIQGYSLAYGALDVPTRGRPVQTGVVGLENLGNTCFMNSSLQCLSSVPNLRGYFLSGAYLAAKNAEAYKTKGQLAESFARLLQTMWREDTAVVAPRNFKNELGRFADQFSGFGQQDSMELIEYVLDGLKEDCNRVRGAKPYIEVQEADGRPDLVVAEEALQAYRCRSDSEIDELFVGFFKSTVRCPAAGCERRSVTFDPFLSIKLPLVEVCKARVGAAVILEETLQAFVADEQLLEADSWFCGCCQAPVRAFKQLQFHVRMLPRVVVIQLKRFSWASSRSTRDRLNTPVEFPLRNLNFAPYCAAGAAASASCTTYDLCAVSKHVGSLGAGHYVAYTRSSEDGAWHLFDDSRVRRVSEEEVAGDKVGAYVLFYLRQDAMPSCWRGT